MLMKYLKRFKNWMDYNPPGALSSKGWRLFRQEYRQKAPIRFWIMHDLRRRTVLPVKWKYEAIRDWIRYRTYDKYHIVKTELKPNYYDKRTIMLHVNFDMLKDFVEGELAWRSWCFEDSDRREKLSFWKRKLPLGYKWSFRDPVRGMKHLEWEATLDDPSLPPHEQSPGQAIAAREKIALYKWWVETRPARVEIELLSPRKKVANDDDEDSLLDIFDTDYDRTTEEYKAYIESIEKRNEQDEQWDNEDEAMLIRLMKIRKTLWT
jgi:hypothetical protein